MRNRGKFLLILLTLFLTLPSFLLTSKAEASGQSITSLEKSISTYILKKDYTSVLRTITYNRDLVRQHFFRVSEYIVLGLNMIKMQIFEH